VCAQIFVTFQRAEAVAERHSWRRELHDYRTTLRIIGNGPQTEPGVDLPFRPRMHLIGDRVAEH